MSQRREIGPGSHCQNPGPGEEEEVKEKAARSLVIAGPTISFIEREKESQQENLAEGDSSLGSVRRNL
jgi:hypothetical protein